MTLRRRFDFSVPPSRVADRPPEARGLQRDGVRLLVAEGDRLVHTHFASLARHLRPGDLLVVNTSPTMPAATDGRIGDRAVVVHFSAMQEPDRWIVELRQPDGSGPILDAAVGDQVTLVSGGVITLSQAVAGQMRLWRAVVDVAEGVAAMLSRYGRPIRYAYVPDEWPAGDYQTIFADRCEFPGSAEMPSAGRPFTWSLVQRLRHAGVGVTGLLLHTGVSSQESHEPPQPEWFRVSDDAARAIQWTRRARGRVVAVGTTVTRALETVGRRDGTIRTGSGWTDLIVTPDRPTRVVDGIITGWHTPGASHLSLLESVAGTAMVETAYRAALENGYLWHEFGDACLLLPERTRASIAA